MSETGSLANASASVDEMQRGWNELTLKVRQLEAEKSALSEEAKGLRFLLERVIDHRQKSHAELVLLLTTLVSKLPLNDVGIIVARLVEHNNNVNQYLSALVKGTADAAMPQPKVLQTLEQTKKDLLAAVKPLVEELIGLGTPLESPMLQSFVTDPELFFAPRTVRANRCFVKGQVPRERITREFGNEALAFFKDVTTDTKLNPNPKPEEIMLAFRDDFEAVFRQNEGALPQKRQELADLYQKVQRSKAPTDEARQQRSAFLKLSFILELLHYYQNMNTEAPDVVFAQRLPALVEQLGLVGGQDVPDEKWIVQAEGLLNYVISAEHRQMIVNNIGKSSASGKTLRYLLTLRVETVLERDAVIVEFVKHLIPSPPQRPPGSAALAAILQRLSPEMQMLVVKAIMASDRLRKEEAESLARATGAALGLTGLDAQLKPQETIPPEIERQVAWARIKDLIARRSDATTIAAAIRDRLHAKYDTEEIRQSWITLTEADAISLIRIFCQIPYRSDGKTDAIARTVMETYVSRLMHEKYATTYNKVVNSLRSMFQAKPDSPTLLNFVSLVRWVQPEAANKVSMDAGMPVPAS